MKINLQHVMPHPLAGIQHSSTSIWGNSIDIDGTKRTLLNASSGKGKSTFTHLMIGIRSDYEGTILFNDRDIRTFDSAEWADLRQKELSIVYQDLQLFPQLTVRENILLKNNLQEFQNEEEIVAQLELLGIADKWQQPCGLLSMGQRQRVAILRALCQPFSLLIMDEPFSHLDKENALICLELISARCKKQGAGFLLTTLGETHDFPFDHTLFL